VFVLTFIGLLLSLDLFVSVTAYSGLSAWDAIAYVPHIAFPAFVFVFTFIAVLLSSGISLLSEVSSELSSELLNALWKCNPCAKSNRRFRPVFRIVLRIERKTDNASPGWKAHFLVRVLPELALTIMFGDLTFLLGQCQMRD